MSIGGPLQSVLPEGHCYECSAAISDLQRSEPRFSNVTRDLGGLPFLGSQHC